MNVASTIEIPQVDEPASKCGRVKLFLGFAAGVGKTYAMLCEAKRRRDESGQDVVIGYVDTHNRKETEAQLGDLEIIPPKSVEYRGAFFDELDVERIVKRKPKWVVVDDLAHANAPGSIRTKRFEDVMELRSHGINVLTAMNVQHLESLNDSVYQITSVKIRETVPDWVLREMDEMVTVDITPRALINRLQRGEIFKTDRVPLALANFFTEGNLSALRELALREIATEVDRSVQSYRNEQGIDAPWQAKERVMVCIDPEHPSDKLLRRGWRVASKLHADIISVYVSTGKEDAKQIKCLENDVKLAKELNIECARLEGRDVASALAEYAWQNQITEIVIGHSNQSRLQERMRGSKINDLIRLVRGIDVLIIAHPDDEQDSKTASKSATKPA